MHVNRLLKWNKQNEVQTYTARSADYYHFFMGASWRSCCVVCVLVYVGIVGYFFLTGALPPLLYSVRASRTWVVNSHNRSM